MNVERRLARDALQLSRLLINLQSPHRRPLAADTRRWGQIEQVTVVACKGHWDTAFPGDTGVGLHMTLFTVYRNA